MIGRNGEMIKKIQNDTGVRIQFKPGELLKLFRSVHLGHWIFLSEIDIKEQSHENRTGKADFFPYSETEQQLQGS